MGPAMTPLKTAFGKRRGWEIQRVERFTPIVWRMPGVNWCRVATSYEVKLWQLLKKLDPEQFKVSR
jgi:hypothetical protein